MFCLTAEDATKRVCWLGLIKETQPTELPASSRFSRYVTGNQRMIKRPDLMKLGLAAGAGSLLGTKLEAQSNNNLLQLLCSPDDMHNGVFKEIGAEAGVDNTLDGRAIGVGDFDK